MKNNILLQKSDCLVHGIYSITKNFPKDEQFGLISQLRRAALSVPLNIVEGFARNQRKEHRRFLEIAYGSLKETKYILHFSYKENYLSGKDYKDLISLCEEIGKLLWKTMQTLKFNQQKTDNS